MLESTALMPDSDYEAEGFGWMAANPGSVPKTIDGAPFNRDNLGWPAFCDWRERDTAMWVVRFELVKVDKRGFLALPIPQRRLVMAEMASRVAPIYSDEHLVDFEMDD